MSKVKIRFFTVADYKEEEAWLRSQHKNGLRLVQTIMPCFFIFEECAPQDVIYQLDYKNCGQGSDYMQMVKDYGWEYFNSCMGWLYFRKPASEMQPEKEEEIFSDEASKVEMIRRIVMTRMLPLLIVFLAIVLPNWYRYMLGDAGEEGTVFGVFFTVLLVVYLYLFVHCGRKLKMLRHRL